MRILILKSDKGDFEKFYISHMKAANVDVCPVFKKMGKYKRYISLIHVQKLKLPKMDFWYGEWKKRLKIYSTVIVFDRNYNWDIVNFIHSINRKCRIIVWYWNPIEKIERLPLKYRSFCEEWSFDKDDCKKYILNYNNQFSFKKIFNAGENVKGDVSDFYFVGMDKNRAELLMKIKSRSERIGKKVNFIIVKDKTSLKNGCIYSQPIDYLSNINNLFNTKTIVELVQNGQSGLTVRCVEALFAKKKIITNNECIKEYDFYHPNNIFILEDDNLYSKGFEMFLEAPYYELSNEVTQKYDFEQWINGFESGNIGI